MMVFIGAACVPATLDTALLIHCNNESETGKNHQSSGV